MGLARRRAARRFRTRGGVLRARHAAVVLAHTGTVGRARPPAGGVSGSSLLFRAGTGAPRLWRRYAFDHGKGRGQSAGRSGAGDRAGPAVLARNRDRDRKRGRISEAHLMRTAIFGGTFDPIHNAHLVVAREAADKFSLDRVLFIPAANPPMKEAGASYEDRYRMVELACAGEPRFEPSRLEAGAQKSYSIHTIERVKAENGDVFFIIGSDAFAEIQSWHRWRDVVAAVEFIVVARPGHRYTAPPGARVHRLETVALPVSSSEIRQKLARGERPDELPSKVTD